MDANLNILAGLATQAKNLLPLAKKPHLEDQDGAAGEAPGEFKFFFLPEDVLVEIFSYFSNYELLSLRLMPFNKKCREITQSIAFEQILARRFGFPNNSKATDVIQERRDWLEVSLDLEKQLLRHFAPHLKGLIDGMQFVNAIEGVNKYIASQSNVRLSIFHPNTGFLQSYLFLEHDPLLRVDATYRQRVEITDWKKNIIVYLLKDINRKSNVNIENAALTIKNSKEIALALIKKNKKNLLSQYKYFSSIVRSDEKIVLKLIQEAPQEFIPLLGDKSIPHDIGLMKEILIRNPELFPEFPAELKSNDELRELAKKSEELKLNPGKLRLLRLDLNADIILLKAKAKQDFKNVEFFSTAAKNDSSLMESIMIQSPEAYQYLSEELKRDIRFIEMALPKCKEVMDWMPADLKTDIRVCKCYFRYHGNYDARHINRLNVESELTGEYDFLKDNSDFMAFYSSSHYARYKYCYELFQNDMEKYAFYENFLFTKSVILKHASKLGRFLLSNLPENELDEEIVIACIVYKKVLGNKDPFSQTPDIFKDNENVARFAIKQDCENFEFVSERLRRNLDFVRWCIDSVPEQKRSRILSYVINDLSDRPEFITFIRPEFLTVVKDHRRYWSHEGVFILAKALGSEHATPEWFLSIYPEIQECDPVSWVCNKSVYEIAAANPRIRLLETVDEMVSNPSVLRIALQTMSQYDPWVVSNHLRFSEIYREVYGQTALLRDEFMYAPPAHFREAGESMQGEEPFDWQLFFEAGEDNKEFPEV